MGRIALIGQARNETNAEVAAAWSALGLDVELLTGWDAVRKLGPGDVAIGRLDVVPTLDGVEPGLYDLLRLEARGVRVLNGARAVLNAHDKLRTARVLAARGVRHVPTRHVRAGELLNVGPPLVLKPRFGSWGRDVFRCDTVAAVAETLELIRERSWFRRHGAVVQPLLPPMGRDLRVLVARGRVVGSNMRIAAPGEWRTNVSLGGSELPATPQPAEAKLAIDAVCALGGDLFGADLMPTAHGYVVVEVNAAVEFNQAYARPGGDIYTDVAAGLFAKEDMDVPLAGVFGIADQDRGAPVPAEAFADRPKPSLAAR